MIDMSLKKHTLFLCQISYTYSVLIKQSVLIAIPFNQQMLFEYSVENTVFHAVQNRCTLNFLEIPVFITINSVYLTKFRAQRFYWK